ncbi:hypothetical protein ACH5RR_023382 [Cinchona calisaya]|uniref:Uncharacterized protein n=1 Tax=Cinchona calisaya TaxID=153742 RepID=A0ABD2ZDY4_9GENT
MAVFSRDASPLETAIAGTNSKSRHLPHRRLRNPACLLPVAGQLIHYASSPQPITLPTKINLYHIPPLRSLQFSHLLPIHRTHMMRFLWLVLSKVYAKVVVCPNFN